MAITTGTQAASGTPATTLYNTLATILTTKSWTHIATKTATVMGTTASCEIWATPDTTVASNVYTGCIVIIEVDDTNARLRVRTCEIFDNGATGSPATNCKYGAPNHATGAAKTPTSTYHISESYVSCGAYKATTTNDAGTTALGYVEVPTSAGGFNYAMGVDSTRMFLGAQGATVMAGYIEYLGTAGGAGAVFLFGSWSICSWIMASSITMYGCVRCSREPLMLSSLAGAFCFGIMGSQAAPSSMDSGEAPTSGYVGIPHQWHTVMVASPAFMHGMRSGVTTFANTVAIFAHSRSHLAKLTNFITFPISGGVGATFLDTITISGTQYTILGGAEVPGNQSTFETALAVETNAF